ncbi:MULTISPECIES: hypothetical protein [unclassified Nostoc]|uniref:hypothetical protein n=1 Tax=unclassified Nostoc TaxID=2593658 RepID=UPI0025AB010D|nr:MULTISPECIES: hypothetical protein [unclassified Nostoc]MDM9582164.1 hypothetical protein [Nostoc sp. GT001]MDZ7947275.1 hypothetical protein [Nostoc sp. EfeVER01]MDZ7995646.1 hypothetical protein [Nostoc sp. EspVER01]
MNFLKKYSNLTIRVICLEILFIAPALADECSSNQRAPLPGCVSAEYISGGTVITNNCPYTVTIKVDIANSSDKRVDVGPNGGRTVVGVGGRFQLFCCPRYNKCA